jgi:hypothetical protein
LRKSDSYYSLPAVRLRISLSFFPLCPQRLCGFLIGIRRAGIGVIQSTKRLSIDNEQLNNQAKNLRIITIVDPKAVSLIDLLTPK